MAEMPLKFTKRIDLHCHSRASTEADEAVLNAIQCPESYSEPAQVYAQAIKRGMHFVTITDHDSLTGVNELLALPRQFPHVIVGEELTCYFPEDHCKMHVLLWGITPEQHTAVQAIAHDIYACAEYIEHQHIAHAVAHPLYRQNDKLERWHVERLLLLFKGFECLNGAHSQLHREAFEPLIDALDMDEIRRLERVHGMRARWDKPAEKARTAGSDDHGLFNIGRTFTEFPDDVRTISDVLDCIRTGRCHPAGEAGSSLKLAHNFYGVGVRYYAQQVAGPQATFQSAMMQRLVGDKPAMGAASMALGGLKHYGSGLLGILGQSLGLTAPKRGTELLGQLFSASAASRLPEHAPVADALSEGRAAFAEHSSMFGLLNEVSRDVVEGIVSSVSNAVGKGEIGAIFDALSAVVAHQALLLPYYFALFHQNQERHLFSRITGHARSTNRETLRIGVFTDSFDSDGPAARFAREIASRASLDQTNVVVHTCSELLVDDDADPHQKNFRPLAARTLPGIGIQGVIPPILEVLEWSDRKQFDVVVVNTAGPMGLCGWLVSKMLRVPMLAVSHDHLPTTVLNLTGHDYRTTAAASGYSRWFISQAQRVLVPSRFAREVISATGVDAEQVTLVPPLAPVRRPETATGRHNVWERNHVAQPLRLLCPTHISSPTDMKLVIAAFKFVCEQRSDVALVSAGEGSCTKLLKGTGLPVYLLPTAITSHLYTGADLLLYPNAGAFGGETVIDAQAAGLPVLVSDRGAAKEFMDDGLTGLVLPATDPAAWANAILELLGDEPRRQRMSRTGMQRVRRLEPSRAFECVVDECLRAVTDRAGEVQESGKPAQATSAVAEVASI